ncbi:unnamed protein product [Schistocephalus solidus]|uniref:proton-translocating NAD(P)(+) transhydrogenase n=1 Tax=Schistocephalus solidus TaxID=70667 RepID=A0A183TPQ8_SCHSO|nr:unnamed protein product [Schistocephalus solidus]
MATKVLTGRGFEVLVEAGAGNNAKFPDGDYAAAGAKLIKSGSRDLYKNADCIVKVRAPSLINENSTFAEVELLRPASIVVSLVYPAQNKPLVDALAKKEITLLALDCVPRISRAQTFDVLSSMANIAGYKGVVEAAALYGRFFAGMVTLFSQSSGVFLESQHLQWYVTVQVSMTVTDCTCMLLPSEILSQTHVYFCVDPLISRSSLDHEDGIILLFHQFHYSKPDTHFRRLVILT